MYGQHMAHIRLHIYCVLFARYHLSHTAASCNICSSSLVISHPAIEEYLVSDTCSASYLQNGTLDLRGYKEDGSLIPKMH